MFKSGVKIFLAFFVLPILWLFSTQLKWVQKWEDYSLYLRYCLRGNLDENKLAQKTGKEPLKIFYLTLDDSALKSVGKEPIPMSHYAKVMYGIQKYSTAKVIATDVFFGEKQYSPLIDLGKVRVDEQLCAYYFSALNRGLVGGWFNCNGKPDLPFLLNEHPLPLIKEGFYDFDQIKAPILPNKNIVGDKMEICLLNPSISTNHDIRTRWLPLYARTQQGIYYALSLETLHLALNPSCVLEIYGDDNAMELYKGEHAVLLVNKDVTVFKQIPLVHRQLLEINWFSSWKNTPDKQLRLDVALKHFEVLESNTTAAEKRDALSFFKQFDNGVVFVSNTFEDSPKIKTEIDDTAVPMITAHANALKTMYWECYIQHLPIFYRFLIIFVLNFFVASLTLYSEIFGKYARKFFYIIVAYFLLAFYLFGTHSCTSHIALPIVEPLGALLTFWGLGTVYQLIVERQQRLRLKRVFGSYLSPEIVSNMLERQQDPQLGGIEKNLTAFFSDIQHFSTFSELLDPESLVTLMNEYLTEITNVIIEEGGNLDKYVGDAVVAMFGAPFDLPKHPLKACFAACKIQEKQKFLRERWARDHSQWPQEVFQMRTRIGLSTGNAIVGNMGSQTRFNFTMMGDTVNIGARCETAGHTYGTYTLVSEDTYKEILGVKNPLVFRFIDRIVVKGRQHPLGIYELIGLQQNLKQETQDCIECFERGIHNYLSRDWKQAIEWFEKSSTMEMFIPERDPGIFTNPSLTFIQRCQYMMQNPPEEDWDGTFVMKTK